MQVPSQVKQVTKALVSVTTRTRLLPPHNTLRPTSQTEKKDKDSCRKSEHGVQGNPVLGGPN